jgi:indole-3-acetate monooxygenase
MKSPMHLVSSALAHVRPQIELLATQAEQIGTFPSEIVGIMEETLVWSSTYPKEAGGVCEDARSLVQMWKSCSEIDGSFGWLAISYGLAASNCTVYLPDQGFEEVFSVTKSPLIAGQYRPNGRGYVESGGYRLTGNWAYGSGIQLANWVVAGFLQIEDGKVVKSGDSTPEIMIALIAKEDVVISGALSTTGLIGTGSLNYSVNELFIPKYRCYSFDGASILRGGSIHHLGITPLSALSHGCWAQGMTERVLKELEQLGRKVVRASDSKPIQAKDTFKEDWARMKARSLASEALLISSTETAASYYEENKVLLPKHQQNIRLAASYANEVCAEAAEIAYRQLGTSAVVKRNPIERVLRDIQTGRQHIMISPQSYVDLATQIWSGGGAA